MVYQAVTPGEPEQNGRCCLNGVGPEVSRVGVTVEVVVGGPGSMAGAGTVGWSVVEWLGLDVRGENDEKNLKRTWILYQQTTVV